MFQFLKTANRAVRRPGIQALIVALTTLLAADTAVAQSRSAEVAERVEQAFSRGDVSALLGHASDRIELGVLGMSTRYSKAQATYVLENFFREYPPVRFRAETPASNGESFFVAGRYWYGPDEQFLDVYFRFRWRGETCEVRELRIERPVR